ncbi:MAG: pyridoxamine 5'-phosphate oxidase family protein [Oscillospiraceae bacterium]|nr:pyridoxamine 5'-phosphate oxidase family protein [Oscillospiraceae bacterium]
MFRELVRIKQKMPLEECIELLKTETRGVLSVLGDDGYPYGSPLNHFYDEESGKIYFHIGSQQSHRTDAVKNYDKASFCVYDKGYRKDDHWALNVKSVIVFGKVKIIDDRNTVEDISRKLSYKFTDDNGYIENEIKNHLHRTLLLELTPEHISGKYVNES